MKVVARAIITIITKIRADKIPRSYPIFSTTNSINPRVFIKTPIAKESRQLMRVQRAINMLPTSLPITATTIIARQINQLHASFKSVI